MPPFDPNAYLAKKNAGFDPDAYLAKKTVSDGGTTAAVLRKAADGVFMGGYDELAGGLATIGNLPEIISTDKTLGDAYRGNRDKYRAIMAETDKQFPKIGGGAELAGMVASPLQKLGHLGTGLIYGLGHSDADITKGEIGKSAVDTGVGGALGFAGGQVADKVIGPIAGWTGSKMTAVRNALAKHLKTGAGKLAEGATGATAVQASKFAKGAGEELLDRGLVRLGDSPGNIATRVGGANKAAQTGIDDALNALDDSGTTLSRDQLIADLVGRIETLKPDTSKAGVIRKLEGLLETISKGPKDLPLSLAEQTKRGFQNQTNYTKPLTTQAAKTVANVYREGVEQVANKANPGLAKLFKEDKATYHLFAPVQEAAERRALQQSQSPWGGLLDMSTLATGLLTDNEEAGVALPIVRRLIAPRLKSSAAVTANTASKLVKKLPVPGGGRLAKKATISGVLKSQPDVQEIIWDKLMKESN